MGHRHCPDMRRSGAPTEAGCSRTRCRRAGTPSFALTVPAIWCQLIAAGRMAAVDFYHSFMRDAPAPTDPTDQESAQSRRWWPVTVIRFGFWRAGDPTSSPAIRQAFRKE